MKRLLVSAVVFMPLLFSSQNTTGEKKWLPYLKFSTKEFINPSLQYAPFTRWWWPGNDVTQEELRREINVFAENQFGGVEIQAMGLVMPTKGEGRADRIMSFDTPSYYDNLRATIDEAKKKGITVDLYDGSWWPAGGPHLKEEDNNLTLNYGSVSLKTDSSQPIKVPRAFRGDRPLAKLVALVAAKVKKDSTASHPYYVLDPKMTVDITSSVNKNGQFTYTPPSDSWRAVAFWSVPNQETPAVNATRDKGFVMNHFDSEKIFKSWDHLFGERTGLPAYYGSGIRAIFDDSYEFKSDRYFSKDFIETFREKRGYDPRPYLPANMWIGYNNMNERMNNPVEHPSFIFSDQDWRLRYDYDLTLSNVIGKNFLKATKDWTESKGMLHRTQAYGFNMDIMASAGLASIPEMETMQFNKGSEGGYKLISSGAHLYNRPLVSSESGVYYHRAFLSTPQKLKMTFDKLMVNGVNQIIYHGTAYSYFPDGYPKDGWFPFWNSALGINFSDNQNEQSPFWKYFKTLNTYVSRSQVVLRSGKPCADVLIYYPFLNYSEEVSNPKEFLVNGYMKDIEPPLKNENNVALYESEAQTHWLEKIWPLLNELNAKGITWDWINDASIQEMKTTADKKLDIRGNIYQSIILFDLPFIQLGSAKNLNAAAKNGADILAVGQLPVIQPSFLNYEKNDKLTARIMAQILKSKSATLIGSVSEMGQWAKRLDYPIKYTVDNDAFRQTRRIMEDGSLAQFIWNESDQWQKLSISVTDKSLGYLYWMDATTGSIIKAESEDGKITYDLSPFSTVFLMAGRNHIAEHPELAKAFHPEKAKVVAALEDWNIRSGQSIVIRSKLFDWRTDDRFKYSSALGEYTTTAKIATIDPEASYFLDLGKVFYGAEVRINGRLAGAAIYTPFLLNITSYLKKGENDIQITITPSRYNDFVGQAVKGEKLYKKLKDSELASQGLIGPVTIYEQQ